MGKPDSRISDSGQSVKEWCVTHEGVSPRQLWYWLRKYKNQNGVLSAQSTRWLSVEISEQTSDVSNSLLVRIGPAIIEVSPSFDPVLLSQVVKVLVALC
ncbi:outer membrane receptor for Fe3+-dicitrate [Moorella thermoacetica Y72]|uniref:Outer membrane receptor for Fe3+-dicitrate n=1 Tax=Moorella thermoacetica Y72 TaxID=1325331 RepID=A0A0S6UDP7_NEOTH|nr:helix-turn-helix domain-containing protein [Moorella thermoacetica]GAF26072.1 outer membrane receptor for Fe3+-dicitrate [Moorella thermoacetica Y72]